MQTPKTFEGSEPTKHIRVKKMQKNRYFLWIAETKKNYEDCIQQTNQSKYTQFKLWQIHVPNKLFYLV
jgi:hypothetical protein